MEKKLALGIDIGGSHITSELFDLEKKQPVTGTKARMDVDQIAGKDEIIAAWADCIRKSCAGVDLRSVAGMGFAMPGPFDYLNGVAWFAGVKKFENLYGVDIRNEIVMKLNLPPDFPVRFFNDAACFALGEAWIGEASSYDRVIALTLGTGFGSTFLVNGFPVEGVDGAPEGGFLYNVPYENSIADDYFSTRWFIHQYEEKAGVSLAGVKELAEAADSDPAVRELFTRFGQNLGSFLVSWIQSFQARCIVLGGNISNSHSLFLDAMLAKFTANDLNPRIIISRLNETATLYGSARLCDSDFYARLINTDHK